VTELGFSPAVREFELHCRKGWNNDRWQALADDIVLEIRTMQPDSRAERGAPPRSSAHPVVSLDAGDSPSMDEIDRVISLGVASER
jgi:hypothetical protein